MRLQGNHLSGWMHPSNRISEVLDIDYYIEIARKVESAKFDSLFITDGLSIINHPWKGLSWHFEPLTLLSALAVSTSTIGLITTSLTTYADPFSIACAFASLDHISKGRAAWNIATRFHPESAANFGDRPLLEHATRYDRAAEFVDVTRKLWDGWDEMPWSQIRVQVRLLTMRKSMRSYTRVIILMCDARGPARVREAFWSTMVK